MPNSLKYKNYRSFLSSRDLSPKLMDWCTSLEGQAAIRNLGNKKIETDVANSSFKIHANKSNTQLILF